MSDAEVKEQLASACSSTVTAQAVHARLSTQRVAEASQLGCSSGNEAVTSGHRWSVTASHVAHDQNKHQSWCLVAGELERPDVSKESPQQLAPLLHRE